MSPLLVIGFLACLLVAFLLSAAESAIRRMSRLTAEDLAEDGRRGADKLVVLLADSAAHLSVTAFVRVCMETTAAVLATIAASSYLEQVWQVLLAAIAVMAAANFVLVGVSPRTLGRQHAVSIALAAAPTVVLLRRVLGPLARLLISLGNAVTPGTVYRDGPFETESELRDLVDLAGESLIIHPGERRMLHSVFELGDTVAREIMVPRTDMLAIERTKNLRQATTLFLRSGYSRVPVLGDSIDDPLGLLYFKDVVQRTYEDLPAPTMSVTEIMRPVTFVPESKPVDHLLEEMQLAQTHMVVVVDEYGGTAGILTIEDILEEIVGEISDEHDRDEPGVEELGDGRTRVPAVMHVDDFAEMFDLDIEEDDVDTLGGLFTKLLGRVPILGATATVGPVRLTAESMAGRRHRIATILVARTSSPDPPTDHTDEGARAEPLEQPRHAWKEQDA